MSLTWRGITKTPGFYNVLFVKLTNPPPPPSFFRVPIVLISLTPALSTVFIQTYLPTRSIVLAITLIFTCRSAVVIGLKIYEYKSPCPDVAQTSLSFFVTDDPRFKPRQIKNMCRLGLCIKLQKSRHFSK